jgi:hypothetical protein
MRTNLLSRSSELLYYDALQSLARWPSGSPDARYCYSLDHALQRFLALAPSRRPGKIAIVLVSADNA